MTAQDYLQKWIKETYPLMDSADYCELDYYDMQKFAVWIVRLLATPDVGVAKRKVCPICWQPLEDGIVKNMCVNDDCPINGGQTERRAIGSNEQAEGVCDCTQLGSTECHKINDKWICSKCNKSLAN